MDGREALLTSSLNSQSGSVCLWDFLSGNILHQFKNGGDIAAKSLNVMKQDYIMAVNIDKPIIQVWPINSQEPVKKLGTILPDKATALSVSPCGSYLAASISHKLYLWHTNSGSLFSIQKRNYQPITCVKFSNCGQFLIVGGQDGLLIAYLMSNLVSFYDNDQTQRELGQLEPLYTKSDHNAPISDVCVGKFASKSRIISVSSDHTARMYSLYSGDLILVLVFNHAITSVLIDPSCWNLYVGLNQGEILRIQLKDPPRTSSQLHVQTSQSNVFDGHKNAVTCLDLNLSGVYLVSGSDDKFVFLWETNSRQILRKFEHKGPITNVKFLLNYNEFHNRNLKFRSFLKPLSRDFLRSEMFTECKLQDYNFLSIDDDDNQEKSIPNGVETERLQAANQELYHIALNLSRRQNNHFT